MIDLHSLRLLLLGPRERIWAPNRRASMLGLAGVLVCVGSLVAAAPHAIRGVAEQPVVVLLLTVLVFLTSRLPLTIHLPHMTNEVLLEGGAVILCLALLDTPTGLTVWILATLLAEWTVRPWTSVILGNVGLATLCLLVASTARDAVLPGPWPTHDLVASTAAGAGLAALYALCEAMLTEIGGRWLAGAVGQPWSWRLPLAGLVPALLLGGAAGAGLTLGGPLMSMTVVGTPLVLAMGLAHVLHVNRGDQDAKRTLVRALTALAAAEHQSDVRRVLLDEGAALAPSADVDIVRLDPATIPPDSHLIHHYALVEQSARSDGPGGPAGSGDRFLRATVRRFTTHIVPSEHADLTILAEAANAATGRIRERERITWTAHHDPLTGVLNRKGFWEADRPERPPAAVLLLDLDGFKAVNDTYGHETGDAVLVATADVLLTHAPAGSAISRWGGDEFVVSLPFDAAEHVDPAQIARHVVADVEAHGRELAPWTPVSASIGVAVQEPDILETTASLVHRADASMYEIKGRRRFSARGTDRRAASSDR